MNRIPQRFILGQALFKTFINNLDDGAEHTLSAITKLEGVVNISDNHNAIHEKWEYKVLHLRMNNPRYQDMLKTA